jgi:hypothetical protein
MSSVPVNRAGTKRRVGFEIITPILKAQMSNRIHKGTDAIKPNGITIRRIVNAATIAWVTAASQRKIHYLD